MELQPKLINLRDLFSDEMEPIFDNRMIYRNAKKQMWQVPDLVLKYAQYINMGDEFNENAIATEYIDKCIEQMQRWYGKIGEIYWNLRCALK